MKKSISLLAVISFICLLSSTSYSQSPNWLWAKNAVGTGWDDGYSVAVDASGNAYVTGFYLSPTITFGNFTLTNAGADIFLVKYDAIGNVLWAKNGGGTTNDRGVSVAVDASGNAYVTGYFNSSTITFGTYTLTNAGSYDIFLVKYDSSGNVLWAKSAGGTSSDDGASVAVDASGNSYVTGAFSSDTITFGSYTLTNASGTEIFLVKYDVSGNVVWATSTTGTSLDRGNSIANDATGNVYITGYFESPAIAFGSYILNNTDGSDIFLAKYDGNGNVIWATNAMGTSWDVGRSVAVDASGNAYVTGNFESPSITFGSFTLTNAGFYDIFLVKYDSAGNVIWAKSSEGTDLDEGNSVAVDAVGNSYVTGAFSSPAITFGSFTLTNTSAPNFDMFLIKYDGSGNVQWATSAGGTDGDGGNSITVDVSGNSIVTGSFNSSTITFGSYFLTNTSAGVGDIFLAKSGSGNVGVDKINNSYNISISPNPATETITIEVPTTSQHIQLSILNFEGQKLLIHQITEHKTQIDISSLPKGVYFVRITNDRMVEVGKFIKQH